MAQSAVALRDQEYVDQLRRQAHSLTGTTQLGLMPVALWPVISNTDMLNQKLGLSPTENDFRPTDHGGSEMYVETYAAGMPMAYEEFPFEWREPEYLAVERIFHKGPLKYLRFGVAAAAEAGGSRLTITMDYVPALPDAIVRGMLQLNLKQMLRQFEACAEKLAKGANRLQVFYAEATPKNARAIEKLAQSWSKFAPASEIPRVLAEYVLLAPDRYAGRIRPFELAAEFGLAPLDTLRCCLLAARAGLLHMRWDMRCPGCKGPKEHAAGLGEVGAHAFCPSCVADYSVGFDQNLELTFFPDPKLRKVDESHFCAGSPANTPHLQAQFNLWPGQQRELALRLEPGQLVLRSLLAETSLSVAADGTAHAELVLDDSLALSQPLAPEIELRVRNPKPYFQSLQFENPAWQARACTGALVCSLQEFRDFFRQEVLAPDRVLPVERQTIWLAGLWRDAEPLAGDEAEESFEQLRQLLRVYDGAEVRSEGQLLLAAFADPLDGLRAALEALAQFSEVNALLRPDDPIDLRIGLHEGPCTVLNQQGRLDYAGESVELALSLLGLADSGELVIGPELMQDPDISWLLVRRQARVEQFLLALEPAGSGDLGPGEGVRLYRITGGQT